MVGRSPRLLAAPCEPRKDATGWGIEGRDHCESIICGALAIKKISKIGVGVCSGTTRWGKPGGGAERPQKCSQQWPGGVRGRLRDPNPWDGDAQEPLPSETGRAGAGTGNIVENQLI